MMIAAQRRRAPWIASTSSPSWLVCNDSTARPCSAATRSVVATWSASVAVPYTSGSRSPSRLRLGPCSSSTIGRSPSTPAHATSPHPSVCCIGVCGSQGSTGARSTRMASAADVGERGPHRRLGHVRAPPRRRRGRRARTSDPPRRTFLSRPISVTSASGVEPAGTVVGRPYVPPTTARCSSTRSSSMRSRRRASSAANTRPTPTASPWVMRCSVAISRAWASVWP